MNKKKLLIIIALCVIAVVSIAVVPTYALYYDEVEFSATIQSRSFNIDKTATDDLNINVNAGKTFKYGFFTESTVGNCNFHFTIDTSALSDCDIALSKRVDGTKTYERVTKTASGSFMDESPYTPNEVRLYLLEVTPLKSSLNAKNVLAKFSSDAKETEIKPMDPPKNGSVFKQYIPEININGIINKTNEFGYRISNIKFLPRTDNVDFIMLNIDAVSAADPSKPSVVLGGKGNEFKFFIMSSIGKDPDPKSPVD
ncbi:MAG: hypothetical protein RR458_00895, partial [Clostridia bacterium]